LGYDVTDVMGVDMTSPTFIAAIASIMLLIIVIFWYSCKRPVKKPKEVTPEMVAPKTEEIKREPRIVSVNPAPAQSTQLAKSESAETGYTSGSSQNSTVPTSGPPPESTNRKFEVPPEWSEIYSAPPTYAEISEMSEPTVTSSSQSCKIAYPIVSRKIQKLGRVRTISNATLEKWKFLANLKIESK